ncbi:MAG: hypothetical protein KAR65_04880 [Anaerolineales bacterium]|nr:hypothetical protein [Anaerolineales bacterium]
MKNNESSKSKSPKKQYPRVYEKVIPVALVILVLAMIFLLLVIAAVVLGFFPGSG